MPQKPKSVGYGSLRLRGRDRQLSEIPNLLPTACATITKVERLLAVGPVVMAIAVTCFASYLMLCAAGRISRLLGVTGITVMNRVIGLIIGAIAIQFVFDGIKDSFPGLMQ